MEHSIKKKIILFLAGACIICISSLAAYSMFDGDVKRGNISGYEQTVEDIDDSEFAIFINNNIAVNDGKANVLIQNHEKNHNSCTVRIYNDSNVLLYESDIIPTGHYIETVKLFEDMPLGESSGYAVFNILNDNNSDTKSTLTVDLKFIVK